MESIAERDLHGKLLGLYDVVRTAEMNTVCMMMLIYRDYHLHMSISHTKASPNGRDMKDARL